MVALIRSITILLANSRGAPKRLSSDAASSKGRVEYNPPKAQPRVSKFHKIANEFFPGSLRDKEVFARTVNTLEMHGLDKENTLCALSVCPDEINHKVGDITDLFHNHFGRCFHLGGLGGIPFTGKTGFAAYSQHVNEKDGNCFVLMAPHIGLSTAQHLGMYTPEPGKERTACGAAIGALQYCLSEKEMPDLSGDDNDYQANLIIQQVKKQQHEIVNQPSENAVQATLAHHMWKLGKQKLDAIINTDFGGPRSKLLVLTGVMINMPPKHGDLFQPLTFDLYLKDGNVLSVFAETFGSQQDGQKANLSKLKP